MPNQIKAAKIAVAPQEHIKKWGNRRLIDALDEHVCCCASFDFDCQLERYEELMYELRRRLGVGE